jgi:hypothetical protein
MKPERIYVVLGVTVTAPEEQLFVPDPKPRPAYCIWFIVCFL